MKIYIQFRRFLAIYAMNYIAWSCFALFSISACQAMERYMNCDPMSYEEPGINEAKLERDILLGGNNGGALLHVVSPMFISQHVETSAKAAFWREFMLENSCFGEAARLHEFWTNAGGLSIKPLLGRSLLDIAGPGKEHEIISLVIDRLLWALALSLVFLAKAGCFFSAISCR